MAIKYALKSISINMISNKLNVQRQKKFINFDLRAKGENKYIGQYEVDKKGTFSSAVYSTFPYCRFLSINLFWLVINKLILSLRLDRDPERKYRGKLALFWRLQAKRLWGRSIRLYYIPSAYKSGPKNETFPRIFKSTDTCIS